MNCRRCEAPLRKPGDYCLTCNTANCDAVVVDFRRDRATLTMLDEDEVVGETIVTTLPEPDEERGGVELRNFAGRVADEIQRKRPETVYAAARRDASEGGGRQGTKYDARDALRETKAQLHHEFYRVTGDDPVHSVLDRRGERSLAVVETPPREKLGGTHSTLIGGRKGRKAIGVVADHPHVKKIIPGPIDAGGKGSRTGLRAKVTRADDNGNVRLLFRDGSSVQENRVVTTAMDRETGEWVREDLNEALYEAGFQGE
ncbi:hypothetical protein SAMN04487949_0774 [Halogranum gelatinilyticum]|uniref:Metal-binding protein n=1 Tax=Halogranum gelatinilyticum TaxID=660521 RepID=A0A1G9QAX6_9EURY|nr:DUF2103 domain-containing protein [Halogranum gelatinilyticum]SDM08224.1 hypothetical protein SAMN04487949_0774 [Halogranum gelatinilyticum]